MWPNFIIWWRFPIPLLFITVFARTERNFWIVRRDGHNCGLSSQEKKPVTSSDFELFIGRRKFWYCGGTDLQSLKVACHFWNPKSQCKSLLKFWCFQLRRSFRVRTFSAKTTYLKLFQWLPSERFHLNCKFQKCCHCDRVGIKLTLEITTCESTRRCYHADNRFRQFDELRGGKKLCDFCYSRQ